MISSHEEVQCCKNLMWTEALRLIKELGSRTPAGENAARNTGNTVKITKMRRNANML